MSKQNFIKRLMRRFFLPLAVLAFMSSNALAISLISDEETELFLQKITAPIFKAAGLPYNRNKVFIVNDDTLNAFVSDGNYLFIHTGTIIAADDAEELSGVIAHETGHITGGHIITQKIKAQEMQRVSLASMILAGGAAAASGDGNVAMAVALGSQSSMMTNYFRYRTEQERSADESAVTFLKKTQQSPTGLYRFMKKINKDNEMSGVEETPYFRTHPMNQERLKFLEKAVKESPYPANKAYQEECSRVKAKLFAFLSEPKETFRKYPLQNTSVAAQYAQAIAYYKLLNMNQALRLMNGLITKEPNNPFFHELKAQMYMETGNVNQAKTEYQKALKLLPTSASLQISLAQATLETEPTQAELKNIINILNKANISQPSSMGWMLLSRAYGMQGDRAYSTYAAAGYSAAIGEYKTALRQLEAAKEYAKGNPALLLKIADLENRIKPLSERQRRY